MGATWAICYALVLASVYQPVAADGFYCLEYWKPIGQVLHDITYPELHTSGQLARDCNAYCSTDPDCTAAWSVAAVTTAGASCKLLSHTADDVAAALQPAAGKPYPSVQPTFVAVNGSQDKSLSWLCLRNQQDWDDFGATTYRTIKPHAAGESWCAYATNSAGINLDGDWQGSSSLAACADSCEASSQCSFWVGRPGHCWLKYSALVGADGWTAANRPAWLGQAVQPNAAATCFKQLQDWRELGQQLSPNVASIEYKGVWYTLFPERVNYTEAAAACKQLPNGRLAQLEGQAALTAVGNALLPTLPMQYTVQVAWVGAQGILDDTTATLLSGDVVTLPGMASSTAKAAADAGGPVPTWQGSSHPVNISLFTHPSEHYLQWQGSDGGFREYVPHEGKPVCVAALGVPPQPVVSALVGTKARGQSAPGLYLFTCRRPTPYICQSSSVPAALSRQSGRIVPKAALLQFTDLRDRNRSTSKHILALSILLPVLAALVLAAASCVCARQLRWLLRSLSMQRKRAMGLPSKGTLTVAVTDIQGYTKLSEAHPQAMGQALLLHNKVIREAAYTNAGHVLAQEGDAFIVGFCDPLDAAVFALQIQQQLMQLETPPELRYDDDADTPSWPAQYTHSHSSKQAYTSRQYSSNGVNHHQHAADLRGQRWPRTPAGQQVRTRPNPASPAACATAGRPALIELPPAGSTATPLSPWPASAIGAGDAGSDLALHARTTSSNSEPDQYWRENLRSMLCPGSNTAKHSSSSQVLSGSSEELPQHGLESWHNASKSSCPAPVLSGSVRRPSSLGRWLSSGAGGWWRTLLSQQGSTAQTGLFKGLRVRVGLATGPITRGQAVEASPAYSMARVISEGGAGGQVLLDAATFQAVHSQLHLLDAVTASGLDYGRLETKRHRAAAAAAATSCCQPCGSPQQSSSKQPSARDAIMLDMGLYETPLSMLPSTATESGTLNLQAIFAKSTTRLVSTTASIQPVLKDSYIVTLPAQMQLIKQQQQQQQPGSWARSLSVLSSVSGYASRAQRSMTGDVSTSSEAGAGCGQVRLYQLLAPELAGRAVVFGSKLALCDDWRCIDPPYFAAPGLCEGQESWSEPASTPDADVPGQNQQQQQFTGHCLSPNGSAQLANSGVPSSPSSTLTALRAMSVNVSLPGVGADVGLGDVSAHHGSNKQPANLRFPPVAVAFVAVEGSERLQQQRFSGIGHLHGLLSRLMMEACGLRGGYLVKTYEAELKYMATFSSAAAAVEWCLVMQEAALHLPYSDDLLRHHQFRPECDAGGQLVFRGPRLKMGVAEGPPTCIVPDHMGRADYLGPVVNQAARACDAAAHGGQIALEQSLSRQVLQHWHRQQMQQQHCQHAHAAAAGQTDTAAAQLLRHAAAADSFAAVVSSNLPQEQPDAGPAGGDQTKQEVAVQVAVQQLGSFLFKGCAKSMLMVHVSPQKLAGRKYPARPPKGKGVRLAHTSGVLEVATVCLPRHVATLDLFV